MIHGIHDLFLNNEKFIKTDANKKLKPRKYKKKTNIHRG